MFHIFVDILASIILNLIAYFVKLFILIEFTILKKKRIYRRNNLQKCLIEFERHLQENCLK